MRWVSGWAEIRPVPFFVMKIYRVSNSSTRKHLQNVNYRDSSFTFPERLTLEHYFYLGSPLLTGNLSFNDLACHPRGISVSSEEPLGIHHLFRERYYFGLWILAAGQHLGRIPTTHRWRDFYLVSLPFCQGSYYLISVAMDVCSVTECYG